MSTLDPLILDMLEWIARSPRSHDDVIETWRTSCPRLTVWEEANDRGLVERRRVGETAGSVVVVVTERGRAYLEANGRGGSARVMPSPLAANPLRQA